jgi:hypothetical protein
MHTVTILAHYIIACRFALDGLSECIKHVQQSVSSMDKNETFFPFILANGMVDVALTLLMIKTA